MSMTLDPIKFSIEEFPACYPPSFFFTIINLPVIYKRHLLHINAATVVRVTSVLFACMMFYSVYAEQFVTRWL